LAGLLFAGLLYFRNRSIEELSRTYIILLSTLRFFLVTILSFLLLGPLIKYLEVEIEPPTVAVVVDNSTSLTISTDSARTKSGVEETVNAVKGAFQNSFRVKTYTFGEDLSQNDAIDFSEQVTNISKAFTSLMDRYANRNLGAVILLSDGIYNRGTNPRYTVENLNVPVYTIALGDTTVRRDARISETAANRIAFLGNSFPIEVTVEADQLNGRNANLSILKDGVPVFNEIINYDKDNFSSTIRAILDAEEPGLQRYEVNLEALEEETILMNNSTSVFIDVLDDRQKVLVLGNSPHPDLKAIREAILFNKNYQVEVELINDFNEEIGEYDLVVMHQLPSFSASSELLLGQIEKETVPLLIVIGGQTRLSALERLQAGITFEEVSNSTNDVRGSVNEGFSLFELEDGVSDLIRSAPPIKVPFGQWRISNSSELLLKQKVGRIDTDEALLVINPSAERKVATLIGEGIWRWRLSNFVIDENHNTFDSFISTLIQYLALKEDKRLFRVNGPELIMENERILFKAELYNASYEPVNDVDVELIVSDEEGEEFPFYFNKTQSAYKFELGALPAGNYTYRATAMRSGSKLSDSGSFGIKPFELESAKLRADHNTLNAIAKTSGGNMYYPAQIGELITQLEQGNSRLQPISFSNEIFNSIISFKWLFFVLFLILSAEWFLRKYLGRY